MPSNQDWFWIENIGETGGSSGARHELRLHLDLVLRDGTFLQISRSVGYGEIEKLDATGHQIAPILGVPFIPGSTSTRVRAGKRHMQTVDDLKIEESLSAKLGLPPS